MAEGASAKGFKLTQITDAKTDIIDINFRSRRGSRGESYVKQRRATKPDVNAFRLIWGMPPNKRFGTFSEAGIPLRRFATVQESGKGLQRTRHATECQPLPSAPFRETGLRQTRASGEVIALWIWMSRLGPTALPKYMYEVFGFGAARVSCLRPSLTHRVTNGNPKRQGGACEPFWAKPRPNPKVPMSVWTSGFLPTTSHLNTIHSPQRSQLGNHQYACTADGTPLRFERKRLRWPKTSLRERPITRAGISTL